MPESISIWLIEHGPRVWPFALGIFVGTGLIIALGQAYLMARREARARRAGLASPLSNISDLRDGMKVLLLGRLQCQGKFCERFEDGAPAAASSLLYRRSFERKGDPHWESMANAQAESLIVNIGNINIILSGPVEVMLGSTVYFERALKYFPGPVRRRIERSIQGFKPFLDELSVELHSLASGDKVLVQATVRQSKSAEGGTYRSHATHFCLVPSSDGEGKPLEPIMLIFEGTPNIIRSYKKPILKSVLYALLLFGLLFVLGGEIAFGVAMERVQGIDFINSDPVPKPFQRGELLSALGLSSLSPIRGNKAAGQMLWRLDSRRDEEPSLIELRARLYQSLGNCSTAAAILIHQGFFERGAALADRCASPTLAARSFYEKGDFKKALAHWIKAEPEWSASNTYKFEAQRFGIELYLLAGERKEAAKAARRLAQALEKRSGNNIIELYNDSVKLDHHLRSRRMYSLADALEARLGDQEALSRLGNLISGAEYPVHLVLYADLFEGEKRIELLNRVNPVELDADDPRARWLALLRSEADPSRFGVPAIGALKKPETFLLEPQKVLLSLLPALEIRIAKTLSAIENPPGHIQQSNADALFSRRVFDFFAGNYSFLEKPGPWRVVENPERPERRAQRLARSWADALKREAPPVKESVAAGIPSDLGAGNLFKLVSVLHEGEEIHKWVRVHGWTLNDGNSILLYNNLIRLFVPGLEQGREDLLHWLRWGARSYPFGCGAYCYMATGAALADMAKQLGDMELSNEMRQRIEPFQEAMLNREIAIPLAVLNLP